jgi:hypothetical protein
MVAILEKAVNQAAFLQGTCGSTTFSGKRIQTIHFDPMTKVFDIVHQGTEVLTIKGLKGGKFSVLQVHELTLNARWIKDLNTEFQEVRREQAKTLIRK